MALKNQILSLITEMRGRLDELESLTRAMPVSSVPSPASFEEEGVVSLLSGKALGFGTEAIDEPLEISPYSLVGDFFQIGAPSPNAVARIESFELSDLHRPADSDELFGWSIYPVEQDSAWMTYEFTLKGIDFEAYDWFEWVLKCSASIPETVSLRFHVDTDSFHDPIQRSDIRLNEYASFIYARLSREEILAHIGNSDVRKIRLELGANGTRSPMRLYNYNVFGKRNKNDS
ncbi:hypothetical protein [Pseudoruegeria sp. SHC-113]|uniref:hypothetical protein n=1 Tax=Pseudoruegeria sp. SHC-113 TaxID=2855439 RepID=UPI0021BA81F1|nr:hypothetical protein [Pseudoruegeria sp. SHC-113]MCT8159969.1 hypothetical protein [Pseudoruegeria sp. SHC-113]